MGQYETDGERFRKLYHPTYYDKADSLHVKQRMDAIDSIQVLGIDKVEQKAYVDASSTGCRVWAGLNGAAWRRGYHGLDGFPGPCWRGIATIHEEL